MIDGRLIDWDRVSDSESIILSEVDERNVDQWKHSLT